MNDSLEQERPFLDDSSDEFKQTPNIRWLNGPKRFNFKSLATHFAVFLATSCIWGAVVISILRYSPETVKPYLQDHTWHAHNSSFLASETDFLTCGHSVQEAKEKGCQYDILTNHWLPGQCTDELSIQKYQSDKSWIPYADENRTEVLTIGELGDLPFYFTSMRDHIVHCGELWKRQFRAFSEGWKYIDQITADAEHSNHCADFLMKKAELPAYREMPIKVVVGKSGCHVRDV